MGSTPGSRRSPGRGHGDPLQYSCLDNSMDRGAQWGTVHRAAKSQTQLSTHTQSDKNVNRTMCASCSVMSNSLQPNGLQPTQAPLSMRFSKQEYWSRQPFPSPGLFLTQGLNPGLLYADSLPPEPPGKPVKSLVSNSNTMRRNNQENPPLQEQTVVSEFKSTGAGTRRVTTPD